jgi:hypothetical protein
MEVYLLRVVPTFDSLPSPFISILAFLFRIFIPAVQHYLLFNFCQVHPVFAMIVSLSILLSSLAISFASPLEVRTVSTLNTAAFEEAQQSDNTATRAFSSTEIKVCQYSTEVGIY